MKNFKNFLIKNKYRLLYLFLTILLWILYTYILMIKLIWMVDWPYESNISYIKGNWFIIILIFIISNFILLILNIKNKIKIHYLYIYLLVFSLIYIVYFQNIYKSYYNNFGM